MVHERRIDVEQDVDVLFGGLCDVNFNRTFEILNRVE